MRKSSLAIASLFALSGILFLTALWQPFILPAYESTLPSKPIRVELVTTDGTPLAGVMVAVGHSTPAGSHIDILVMDGSGARATNLNVTSLDTVQVEILGTGQMKVFGVGRLNLTSDGRCWLLILDYNRGTAA